MYTNYRERFPSDLNSNLDSSLDAAERPIDRLTAFSYSPRIGSSLWRFRAGDNTITEDVVHQIAVKAGTSDHIARISLWIYLWGNRCTRCHGKQHERIGDKTIECPGCGGKGWVKLQDHQLAKLMRCTIDQARKSWKAINRCIEVISRADRKVSLTMRLRLVEISG